MSQAAKAAIEKRTGGGTITKVEKATSGTTISYEGTIKTKAGRTTEYAVTADGKAKKD